MEYRAGSIAAPAPLARIRWGPAAAEWGLCAGLSLAGIFHPESPRTWFLCLGIGFVAIELPVLAASLLIALASSRARERLQGPRRIPQLMLRGGLESASAAWIAACLLAWPLTRLALGHPIGLTWSLAEAGGPLRTVIQTVLALLALDAWLYWKHRLLHVRWLFPFHRTHHGHRDPTALSSFAVGPLESLLTFWPILLLSIPRGPHWAPLYFVLISGFILLNLYLHCGVTVRALEATLPWLLVNTSRHHNVHHADATTHYAEAFTIWDHLCKTMRRYGT